MRQSKTGGPKLTKKSNTTQAEMENQEEDGENVAKDEEEHDRPGSESAYDSNVERMAMRWWWT